MSLTDLLKIYHNQVLINYYQGTSVKFIDVLSCIFCFIIAYPLIVECRLSRQGPSSKTYTNWINLPLFSTVVPAIIFMFLSCRPFVAITTLSTGLVGVDNVVMATKGLQDRNINIIAGTTVENKGKLILTEIFPLMKKHDIF